MFIKPTDQSTLPAANWQDKAGNAHFILQSKKPDTFRSFFSNLSTQKDGFKKSVSEYDFRIILQTQKAKYVIAVDDTFEKIHEVIDSNTGLELGGKELLDKAK